MKTTLIKVMMIGATVLCGYGVQAQNVSIKSNLLYDATGTINIGAELGISKKITIDISGNLNPWTYNKRTNTKMKHFMLQPGVRYWLFGRFAGHFIGANVQWADYNVGALNLPFGWMDNSLAQYRYRGNLYGAGISYGYQWFYRKRWAVEAEIGLGYAYLKYKKYHSVSGGEYVGNYKNNYIGPTKAAVSLIYFIK